MPDVWNWAMIPVQVQFVHDLALEDERLAPR
jgi:hypothetical protein